MLCETGTIGMTIRAVLWDLDGTLVDTAPDLCAVLATLLARRGAPLLPFALARNEVSNGAVGMLKAAFPDDCGADALHALRLEFLDIYLESVSNFSRIFSGIDIFLNILDKELVPWGIVTNKPRAMTEPLLAALGLDGRAACVVSGDRLTERKPHPAPLLLAASELALDPAQCVYIGDAPRDIEAGRAAGMATIAAAYGYIPMREDPYSWGADLVVHRPRELDAAYRTLAPRAGNRQRA